MLPAQPTPPTHIDVAILGAGPIGLDAALAVAATGRSFLVLEQGSCPAAGIRRWGSVRLFSPWSMNVSERMRAALRSSGQEPPTTDNCPTGNELCTHALDPVAGLPAIAPHLSMNTRVVAVGREGLLKREEIGTARRAQQPFRLLLETCAGEQVLNANTVLDCTGGQHQPHWLGHSGIPAPGERQLDQHNEGLLVRTVDQFLELDPQASDRILLVGAGHSAQTAAVALAATLDDQPLDSKGSPSQDPSTREVVAGGSVTWVLRGSGANIAPIEDDPLPERSALQAKARSLLDGSHPKFVVHSNSTVERIEHGTESPVLSVRLRTPSGTTHVRVDRIVALVGAMGDQRLYRELQVQECYATAGPMRLAAALLGEDEPEGDGGSDCLAQVSQGPETLLTPEPGYFILGNKSYGRNNAFLLRIGYQQIDDVLTLI